MYSLLSILIIIPLIPIIIWSATGAITTAIIIALGISFWKGRKQIYMSVLGMQSAGKTTWYDYLRGENRASEGATSGGVEIATRQFGVQVRFGVQPYIASYNQVRSAAQDCSALLCCADSQCLQCCVFNHLKSLQ